jgi:hypothetical protein
MTVPRVAAAIALALLTAVTAGCASVRFGSGPRTYIRVAEALGAANLNEGLRIAVPRLQPEVIRQGCRTLPYIVRLQAPSLNMQMQIGEPLVLSGLSVVALDNANVIVAGVPLAIEAEDQSPPVLQLRSDDPDLGRGTLRTVNTGEFRLRIYTLCGNPGAEAVMSVTVVPVPEAAPLPVFPGQVTNGGR